MNAGEKIRGKVHMAGKQQEGTKLPTSAWQGNCELEGHPCVQEQAGAEHGQKFRKTDQRLGHGSS